MIQISIIISMIVNRSRVDENPASSGIGKWNEYRQMKVREDHSLMTRDHSHIDSKIMFIQTAREESVLRLEIV